jgi:NADPH2:quinone reductase
MTRVVRLKAPGGIDQLEVADIAVAKPGAGEILIRQTAIGVNFIDIYQRSGLYPVPALPSVLGVEGVGVVQALGTDVTSLALGDRIAYAGAPVGAYAAERLLPSWRAILLPPTISDELAAAALVKGLTVHMLLARVFPAGPESTVLVHGAAGGLGSLLVKWLKHRRATVIGTVGSASKAALARRNGCDHVIIGRDVDLAREVAALTKGRGVDAACDGIGGTTLAKTFACVRPFGMVASIGSAGGPIPPLEVEELGPRRSLLFARPSVMAYMNEPETYRQAAAEVLATLEAGLVPTIGRAYPLDEAGTAQADLEAGRTTGSLYLVP